MSSVMWRQPARQSNRNQSSRALLCGITYVISRKCSVKILKETRRSVESEPLDALNRMTNPDTRH